MGLLRGTQLRLQPAVHVGLQPVHVGLQSSAAATAHMCRCRGQQGSVTLTLTLTLTLTDGSHVPVSRAAG